MALHRAEVLPAPLEAEAEARAIQELGTEEGGAARSLLIEHNLRLVVFDTMALHRCKAPAFCVPLEYLPVFGKCQAGRLRRLAGAAVGSLGVCGVYLFRLGNPAFRTLRHVQSRQRLEGRLLCAPSCLSAHIPLKALLL